MEQRTTERSGKIGKAVARHGSGNDPGRTPSSKANAAGSGTSAERRLPPGPSDRYLSVDDLLDWMAENFAKYGDIYRASVFGSEVYVVSNPEYCDRILRWNWRNYPRKGQIIKRIALLLGTGLMASNGEFWASQRRMIQPAFSKSAIAGLTDMIAHINGELLAAWRQAASRREMVNVTRDISAMVLKTTLTAIFGDDYEAAAPHFEVLAGQAGRNLGFVEALRPADRIIKQLAGKRRQGEALTHDFLGTMVHARDRVRGEPMSDAQLVREVATLVVAGHETTASLLNWIWYLLSRHPHVQEKLLAELQSLPWTGSPVPDALAKYTYVRQVIEEALRLYPPGWLMTRKAVQDDHLGEYFVPAGTEIYISPYLIHRSPGLWEAPEEFNPDRITEANSGDRPELALCPFGAGPRNCIGERFARVEIQIHLMMMARELRLRYDEAAPAEMSAGLNLHSKHDFMMLPEKIGPGLSG